MLHQPAFITTHWSLIFDLETIYTIIFLGQLWPWVLTVKVKVKCLANLATHEVWRKIVCNIWTEQKKKKKEKVCSHSERLVCLCLIFIVKYWTPHVWNGHSVSSSDTIVFHTLYDFEKLQIKMLIRNYVLFLSYLLVASLVWSFVTLLCTHLHTVETLAQMLCDSWSVLVYRLCKYCSTANVKCIPSFFSQIGDLVSQLSVNIVYSWWHHWNNQILKRTLCWTSNF